MAVGLKVKFNWYQIGESELLYSFFQQLHTILRIIFGEVNFLLL